MQITKFKIGITETLNRVVEVEATSLEDALALVEDKYFSEEIVLDSNDYVDVEFEHDCESVCANCKYFNQCGDYERSEQCNGKVVS